MSIAVELFLWELQIWRGAKWLGLGISGCGVALSSGLCEFYRIFVRERGGDKNKVFYFFFLCCGTLVDRFLRVSFGL